ncbi:tail fibers protein [Klebsiella phage KL01]|uniref:Tail fibers protein n=1 Tax=Klebsiella phage KL01 TaxID=3077152 RepID=A0AA96TCX3_9CAUD|nr:phage tail fiber protein [Sphingobacterium alkalisoli]WNV46848.1 tail fibers protein [Klebsiella phage KL01]GGH32630.1 hypothetical protein GCM10011418_46250 [Sphingobacterium alkalisoli]
MSYTFTVDIGDGSKTIFPFSFAGQDEGYLSVSNIQVFVAGTSVPFTIPTNDPNKVYLTSAPPVGAEVLIRRIMPKDVPYSDFARGNPFSQDTLNDTNLQMLYVIQEILDGFLPDGFYLKGDLNMGGHKVTNMAPGSQDGDATNWEQLQEQVERNDEQDQRLEAIESSLVANVGIRTVPYYYIATGGEIRWQLPLPFQSALLFINGVFQNQNLGAFSISTNGFNFAEPLVKGDEVYALLGSGAAAADDYVTLTQLSQTNPPGGNIPKSWTGRGLDDAMRSASGSSQGLFPLFMDKLIKYRHGVSGYPSVYRVFGFGSSVGDGATLPDPSTQAPVIKFFDYLNLAINKGNIYPLQVTNKSVGGSTINDFLNIQWPSVVASGIYPDLVMFAYGMNDFPTANYNAGQTFGTNGFEERLRKAIQLVKDAGADVVLTTSPHPFIANYSWSMPPGVSQTWPTAVAAPVSDSQIIPPVAQSNATINWRGTNIDVGVRFLRGNDAIRRVAVEMGCLLVDVEKYWFDAMVNYGEAALFNAGQIVHPNLLGHQKSYWLAFEELFKNMEINGWVSPDSSYHRTLDVGGNSLASNPKTADIDLMANGIRIHAFINRDKNGRALVTVEQDGSRIDTSYTNPDPTTGNPGYSLDWKTYHSRFKGLFSTGEVQSIPIKNRQSYKIFIDAWTSAQTSWVQITELYVANREGTVTFSIVNELDNTPSPNRRLYSIASASNAINITALVNLTSLKVRVEGFDS